MESQNSRETSLPAPMSAEEADLVLRGLNDTAAPYPQDRLIHELFETQVHRSPTAIALILEHEAVTYAQLNRRANRVAHELLACGLKPDGRVGVYADRSIEMIVGMLGILKAGGAYVPLDPAYPAERLLFMSHDSALVAVLTTTELVGEIPIPALPTILMDDGGPTQGEHNPVVSGLSSRNLAYVIYTSGSSGRPKGVMIEHRSVLRLVVNAAYAEIRREDCVAHCASPSFDAATWEVWGPLLNGARVLVVPQRIVLSPVLFNEELIKHRASAMFLTVGLFHKYVDALEQAFSQLRYLLVGGDVMAPSMAARALAKVSPPKQLLNVYGPTETTTFATAFVVTREAARADSLPIGKPITNTRAYVLDGDRMPVGVGVAGEIYVGGPGVARGYLNQPELTAERFVEDSFDRKLGEKLYRTGDLGRWTADGDLQFLGRVDLQLKVRGFRIEPGEVEAVLQRQPCVTDAVVIAREDEPGDKRLVAYVVAQLSQREGAREQVVAGLWVSLQQTLPPYLVPAAIVVLDEFPLTQNGKVDRRALPVPQAQQRGDEEAVGEHSPLETTLSEVWGQLLKVEQVGMDDNFFELGGDSMMGLELIAKIGERVGIDGLSVIAIFEYPTVREMAQFIAAQANAESTLVGNCRTPDREAASAQ